MEHEDLTNKACVWFKLSKDHKRNVKCLYCKYKNKYNSFPDIRLDSSAIKSIILPKNTPIRISNDELKKDWPKQYCFNRKRFNIFLNDFSDKNFWNNVIKNTK